MSDEIKTSDEAKECAGDLLCIIPENYSPDATKRGIYEFRIQQLLTQRDEEIAELRRDKARLDWLESNKREGRWMPISRFWYLLSPGQRPFQTQEHKGDTLRQAIDLAMSKDAKGPPCT